MKKKNLKSLKISKVLISNFSPNTIKGGGESRISCDPNPYACVGQSFYQICTPVEDPK
jgi:hypothetical protein